MGIGVGELFNVVGSRGFGGCDGEVAGGVAGASAVPICESSVACVTPKLRESDLFKSASDGWKEWLRLPCL